MTTVDWDESATLIVNGDPQPRELGVAWGGFAGSTESNNFKFLVRGFLDLPLDRQGRAFIRVGMHSFGPDEIREFAQREDYPFN